MTAIALLGIEKAFGATTVLRGVDLAIKSGEFLTLVGPSGCGKSTLLRILAGLEAQDGGDVSIDRKNVNEVRASDRDLAMVFQSYALYPHLTVAENMLTPLRMRDLGFMSRLPVLGPALSRRQHRDLYSQVRETAAVLKIEDLLHRKPGQLSGGQRQRAALGRAMVRNPAAFLMDEPLSNLDAALRVHMRAELSELHRTLGATFVYVTHDQAEALTMSDRMAVMMDGEILQLDKPDVVYNDPTDLRVAEFVGSPKINTLPGVIDDEGRISCLGFSLERRASHLNSTVTVGLRSESMKLCSVLDRRSVEGRAVHRENLGSDVYLHIAVSDGAHRIVCRLTAAEARDVSIGDSVCFDWNRGEELIFASDGKRLRTGLRSTVELKREAVA